MVAPAERSASAKRKAAGKRTADGLPVHSFRTLLADLGTLTCNRCERSGGGEEFTLLASPTQVQQRAFDLLGLAPGL